MEKHFSAGFTLTRRKIAMPFRLRKDAKDWFKGITEDLGLDFDIFYFCLMAGLATGRKAFPSGSEATDLAQDFPGEYRSKGRIIVALLLTRELKALGVKFEERATLHTEIAKLIDPLSSAHLSAQGMEEINHYAFGGFDVLTEWFDDRPRHLETFLPQFRLHFKNALESQSGAAT
jgi:hypothetical protein